jgi:F-type H+-transporting ATPase subunit b
MAETKIAQAEAQATADVRAAATDAAVAAAERMLIEKTRGRASETLLDQGIRDLRGKLS